MRCDCSLADLFFFYYYDFTEKCVLVPGWTPACHSAAGQLIFSHSDITMWEVGEKLEIPHRATVLSLPAFKSSRAVSMKGDDLFIYVLIFSVSLEKLQTGNRRNNPVCVCVCVR